MVSILMDFVPHEMQKGISMKHETAGKKASSSKTIQLMTEKTIQRDKGRAECRKDKKKGQVKSQLWPTEAKHTASMSTVLWRPQ